MHGQNLEHIISVFCVSVPEFVVFFMNNESLNELLWNVMQVWYEWSVTSPSSSPIHNTNGRSYWVGL